MPFFSVIVPVYNVEKYIEKCLKSIHNQTFSDYEVIIINDGTKDRSCEIIRARCLYDCRFQIFDKSNGGLSSARNEGLKHATGKYIIFVDSDDWIEPDYFLKISLQIKEDIDIMVCKYQLDDTVIGARYIPYESEHINLVYAGEKKEKQIVEKHLVAYPRKGYEMKDTLMPVWKNVYRRIFLQDTELTFVSEREVMAEDYVFNAFAYYYAKSVQVTDIAGYVHVIVQGTLSRSYRFNAVEMSICKHERVRDFIDKHEFVDRHSIEQAELFNFASSFAGDIRSFCVSREKGKVKCIRAWYRMPELKEIFTVRTDFNLQRPLYFCTKVMLSRSPLICLIVFNIVSKFNTSYRLMQKILRK